MTTSGRSQRPCYAFSWGDEPFDRKPGEHVWQQQPFYNQDNRVWCSRCGWLTENASDQTAASGDLGASGGAE